jgi:hypothetical protein
MNNPLSARCRRVLATFVLSIMCAAAYAQRSLSSDDIFVFDNQFGKSDFKKRFKNSKDHFWDYFAHELAFYEGAGYSTLTGLANGGFGNNVGLAYVCNFVPNAWAILLGAEFGIYNTKYKNEHITKSYSLDRVEITELDIADDLMYVVDMNGVNETSRVFMINVPIMLRYTFSTAFFGSATGKGGYQFGSPDVHTFYVAAGVKLGVFAPHSKYTSTYDKAYVSMMNYATGQQHGGEGYEDEPLYSLKTYSNEKENGKFSLNTSVMLSFEFGYVLPLMKLLYTKPVHEKIKFYAGIYFDYGLNRLATLKPAPLMYNYDVTNKPDFVSATATNPMHNMTIGLKVTASFTWTPKSTY